jgi:hypothetical protein
MQGFLSKKAPIFRTFFGTPSGLLLLLFGNSRSRPEEDTKQTRRKGAQPMTSNQGKQSQTVTALRPALINFFPDAEDALRSGYEIVRKYGTKK